jgi:hypothetical protein
VAEGYFPPASDAASDDPGAIRRHSRDVARAVRLAMQGKLNAVATVTLTPGATTTTLNDPRISASSYIGLMPTTASAAAAAAYVLSQTTGTATISHASSAATDKVFRCLIIG